MKLSNVTRRIGVLENYFCEKRQTLNKRRALALELKRELKRELKHMRFSMKNFKKDFEDFKKTIKFDADALKCFFKNTEEELAFHQAVFLMQITNDFPQILENHIKEGMKKYSQGIEDFRITSKIFTKEKINYFFKQYEKMIQLSYIETIIRFYKKMHLQAKND